MRTSKYIVAENGGHVAEVQLGMGTDVSPPAARYLVCGPGRGRAAAIEEHPAFAWKLWGVPSAMKVVGETEQPERVRVVAGPEFATAIWTVSSTVARIVKLPELPVLLLSPWYIAEMRAEDAAVYFTEHDPEARLQGLAENAPSGSLLCHVTNPPGL